MPKYSANEDSMETAYGSPSPDTSSAESSSGPEESVDQEEAEGTTAIVPNKLLSPEGESLKEGDEIVVRVVKNYGDESEIEYAPKKEGEYDEEETTEEPMSTVGKELTALSEEGQ